MGLRLRRNGEGKGKAFFTAQDRDNLKWFWQNYMKKNTPWLLLVFGLILIQAMAYKQFLTLTETGLRVIFNEGHETQLFRVCAMVFGLFLLRGFISYVTPRLSTRLASTAVMELRHRLINHLMTLDLAYFERTSPGDIILRLVNQVETL